MNDLTEQLDKMIQKAALDGALTTKAVDQFHSLVKQCDEQADELRSLQKVNTEVIDARDKLKARVTVVETECEAWAGREQDLMTREQEITKLEMVAEYELQRVKDHQQMFTTVFRNSVLRKEVMTPTQAAFDQYNNRQDSYPSKDTVEEEEG